jgi:hypothetical protein
MGRIGTEYAAVDSGEDEPASYGEEKTVQRGLLQSSFSNLLLGGAEMTEPVGGMLVTEFSPSVTPDGVGELQVTAEAVCAVATSSAEGLAFGTVLVTVVAVDVSRSHEIQVGRMEWFPLLFGEQPKDYLRPLPPGALGVKGVTVACVGRMDVGSSVPCSSSIAAVLRRERHGDAFSTGVRWLICSVYFFRGCTSAYVYGRGSLYGR